jgi:HEAT repeat protein
VSALILGFAEGKQAWFWELTGSIALFLLLLNVLLLVAVHVRRLRQYARGRREKRFRAHVQEILAELDPKTSTRDPRWLREQVGRFGELERPIAAVMLIERMRPASEEERVDALAVLREIGAVDRLVGSTGRWMPWRRALALRTLGRIGADEAVPVAIERVSDHSRYVRESAVRALGRIGDARALPILGELFRSPGRIGAGVVYDALIVLGRDAEPVFAGALRSPIESVRVASCFGVVALSEPEEARSLLEPLLDDEAAPVRAAAARSLCDVGGELVPEALARASRDEHSSVRSAAAAALGSCDDPRAVEFVLNALLDADRDTAVRAGEALVRLSLRPAAGPAASRGLQRAGVEAWPVQRARTLASVGVV